MEVSAPFPADTTLHTSMGIWPFPSTGLGPSTSQTVRAMLVLPNSGCSYKRPFCLVETPYSAPSEHCGLVGQLAEFVIALHRPAAADAPQNPVRGVPLRRRDRAFRHRMETLDTAHSAQIIAVWEEVLEIPEWQYEPFWIHGDLHSANILVQQQRISAIIDFGDMAGGDPAVDLAAGWILFDAEARSRFEQEVGAALGPDPALWQRARGWALNLGTALLANSDDNPQFRALGDHVVNAVLAD